MVVFLVHKLLFLATREQPSIATDMLSYHNFLGYFNYLLKIYCGFANFLFCDTPNVHNFDKVKRYGIILSKYSGEHEAVDDCAIPVS